MERSDGGEAHLHSPAPIPRAPRVPKAPKGSEHSRFPLQDQVQGDAAGGAVVKAMLPTRAALQMSMTAITF